MEPQLTTAKKFLQATPVADHPRNQASNTELLAVSLRKMLLRIDAVCTITGLSVPTIYRMMSQGGFPRPLKITSHARAWKLSDINAWIDSRELGGTP
jgi:prophage regulatory protein